MSKKKEISERTAQMERSFMELHNQGMTISQIAEKFDLQPRTVYYRLQAIADDNGVTRESLLQQVITRTSNRNITKRNVNYPPVEKLEKEFKETIKDIDTLLGTVSEMIKSIPTEEEEKSDEVR